MRHLTAALLVAAFGVASVSAALACEGSMKTASTPTTVASTGDGSPSSTKIKVPATAQPQG